MPLHIGGNIDSSYHDKFDDWAREFLSEVPCLGEAVQVDPVKPEMKPPGCWN